MSEVDPTPGEEPGEELAPRKQVSTLRKIFDWILGILLIIAGIIAGPIPILQGWIFVGLGLMVLSSHSRLARKLLDRLKQAGHDIKARVGGRGKSGQEPPSEG